MFEALTERQSHILRATRTLVAKRGYASVSLRDIAAKAGYSPAALYAHFSGREAILNALGDDIRAELGETLKRASAKGAAPIDRLVEIGGAYIEFALTRPAEFELLFRWTRSGRRNRADHRTSPLDIVKAVAREVRPEASDDEIELSSLGLWSAAHGLACLRTTHLSGFPGNWEAWSRQVLRAQIEGALCVSRG